MEVIAGGACVVVGVLLGYAICAQSVKKGAAIARGQDPGN